MAKEKRLEDMTEPELRDLFNKIARRLEAMLPPGPSAKGKCLFFLIVNGECGPGVSQYVSNARRKEAIDMLRETADRLQRNEDVTR